MQAGDFAALDFPLLRDHFGRNTGNQLNSPLFAHMVAGLGTGLFLFDDHGCAGQSARHVRQPRRRRRRRALDELRRRRVRLNLDRIVEPTAWRTARATTWRSPGRARRRCATARSIRRSRVPLGATLIQTPRRSANGIVLDSWLDFEPLVVTGELEDFLPWIRDALAGKPPRLDVSIAQLDHNLKVAHRLVAQRAQLVKIEFPALDASSKDLFDVTLSFQPERVTSGTSGDQVTGSIAKQKRAGLANFKVTIPGVDCTRVARVAPITVAFEAGASGVVTGRGRSSEQLTMRVGDLALGVGEAGAAGFVDWAKASLLEGKTEGLATTATVELLTQDLKSTVLRLDAAGVGLYALRRVQGSGDRMTSYDVSCFVEQWAVGK
jgi:hypothetical protein